MLQYQPNGTVTFSLFSDFPQLFCMMTTRALGDFDPPKKLILRELPDIPPAFTDLITMKQIHSQKVAYVKKTQQRKIITDTDALITTDAHLLLAVATADCVPVFIYDPTRRVVAIVHCGWRGTIKNIIGETLGELKTLGVSVDDLIVGIGPHIGGCCYCVPKSRVDLFRQHFPSGVTYSSQGSWFVDLGQAVKIQLKVLGVLEKNIDAPICCTSCQHDLFFSFRKDTKKTFGEMLGVIGMVN